MRRLLIAILLIASSSFVLAKKPVTIDELKTRIEKADKKKLPELYADLAKLQIEAANDAYNTDPENAKRLMEDGTQSAEKASENAIETGKRLKKTEIDLRKMENRMEDIRRSWSVEDREPVGPQIKRVEAARSKLLDRMFRK